MTIKHLSASNTSQKLPNNIARKAFTKNPAQSISNQAQLARDLAFIEALIAAQDIRELANAVPRPAEGITTDILDIPGESSGRRIGNMPTKPEGAKGASDSGFNSGFDDPLAGQRNRRHGSLVAPPGMPSKGSLVGQYTDTPASTDDHSADGSSGRPETRTSFVRVERHTERTSADGLDTWGSTLYRDDSSGDHWRSDQHTQRNDDGSVTTTDTIFDSHGEPLKTSVVVTSPYGVETETFTNHRTGETVTRDITPKVAPEPAPKPAKYEPDEGAPRGDPKAPRGWSNPISGVVHNPGLPTSNNQVNPGPEDSQPALTPLRLDPRDLVINPAPDAPQSSGAVRDIRHDEAGVNIVDPPRPAL